MNRLNKIKQNLKALGDCFAASLRGRTHTSVKCEADSSALRYLILEYFKVR